MSINLVDSICYSLVSNKIRDRNDALEKLGDINFTLKATKNSFTYSLVIKLISSLETYIEIEKAIFEKSRSNLTVENRLNKASNILRSVIVNILCSKNILLAFKTRQNEQIINMLLKNLFYTPESSSVSIFEPLILNIIKSLNSLINLEYFKGRLSLSHIERVLVSSIKCLRIVLADQENSSKNENLTIELFTLIYQILNPKHTSNYLFFNGNSKTTINLQIFNVLLKYYKNWFADSKREKESLIYVFKIMNKLLINLSTSDIKTCHRIYKLGTHFIIEIKSLTSQRLLKQLSLYINLISPFITLNQFPKISGDNWNLDFYDDINPSNHLKSSSILNSGTISDVQVSDSRSANNQPSTEGDDSIVISLSENEDSINELFLSSSNNKRNRYENEHTDTELNNLSKFIEIVFNIFHDNTTSKQVELASNSFNIHSYPIDNKLTNWFHMRYTSLKKNSDPTPWLLRLGLIKLIKNYYSLKQEINEVNNLALMHVSKRIKTLNFETGTFQISILLKDFDDSIDFYISTITDNNLLNSNYSILITQLLMFELSDIASTLKCKSSKYLFDLISHNKEKLLTNLLNVFEKQKTHLKFWSFTCLILISKITIYQKQVIDPFSKYLSILINKILTYSLEFLKDPIISNLACIFLSNFATSYDSLNSKGFLLDKNIIQHYENIINISEINGPAIISKESVLFWINNLGFCKKFKFKNINMYTTMNKNESQLYGYKVLNWIFSKTEQLFKLSQLNDITLIAILINWIQCHHDITIKSNFLLNLNEKYDGELLYVVEMIRDQSKILNYILMETDSIEYDLFNDHVPSIILKSSQLNESTLKNFQRWFSQLFEAISENPFSRYFSEWCLALCIASWEQDSDQLCVLKKLGDECKDKFKNHENSKEPFTPIRTFMNIIYQIPINETGLIKLVDDVAPMTQLIKLGIRQLSFENNETDEKNYDDFDPFDTFLPRTDKRYESNGSFANYDVYNHRYLLKTTTLEKCTVNVCIKYYTLYKSLDESIEMSFKWVSKLESVFQKMACLYEVLNIIEENKLVDLSEKTLTEFFINVTILIEDQCLSTYECLLILVCKIFNFFGHQWIRNTSSIIYEDGKKVYDYILLLYQRGKIQNEQLLSEIFRLFSKISYLHDPFSNSDEKHLFHTITDCFKNFDNYNKYLAIPSIISLIKNSNNKIEMYGNFVSAFKEPQSAAESSALFCYFMTAISASSESLIIASICNLLELSSFKQINAYLPYAIKNIVIINKIPHPHALFWNFKEIFLKCWQSFDFSMEKFPFKLFGFKSLNDFFLKTDREITALALAYNTKNIISTLSKHINMKESLIVKDSFSLAIALAWSNNGVKNSVFKYFSNYLKTKKEQESTLKDQYLLIIYQLLRFCDCSSEVELLRVCHSKDPELITKSPLSKNTPLLLFLEEYELSISPKSCIKMIDYFNDQYNSSKGNSINILYHLIMKVLLLIDSSVLNIEKKIHIRRLKLLLTLSPKGISNFHICNLIGTNISSYFLIDELREDSLSILNYLLICNFENPHNISVKICSLILSNLIKLHHHTSPLLESFKSTFLEMKEKIDLKEYNSIFNYGCHIFDKNIEIEINEIVKFINSAFLDSENTYILINFLSLLFENDNKITDIPIDNTEVVLSQVFIQNIYQLTKKYQDMLSQNMILWIGKILGFYYLHTGKCPNVEFFEFDTFILKQNNMLEFEKEAKSLDLCFKYLVEELPTATLSSKYCIEAIVGVVLNKHNSKPIDVTSFISYDEIFASFESHIFFMDDYMCSLSISQIESNNILFFKNDLSYILNGFSTVVKTAKFEEWITKICFAIINELSVLSNNLVMLLAIYISNTPEFAIKCFCPLVLYYIQNQPLSKSKLVSLMIQNFFEEDMSKISKDAIVLFLELVLLVRIGAKQNSTKFANILKTFDVSKIYKAAFQIKRYKSVLMLFEEDHFSTGGFFTENVFTSHEETNFIKKTYEGLDDKDLGFGLPIVSNLEYGLEMLNNNGNKWSIMEFNNAKFEANLTHETYQGVNSINEISNNMMLMGWSGVSKIIHEYSNEFMTQEKYDHSDMFYEQLWKLNQWDIPVSDANLSENKIVYNTLKQIRESPLCCIDICNSSIKQIIGENVSNFNKGGFNDSISAWMRTLGLVNTIRDLSMLDDSTLEPNISKLEKCTSWFKNATVDQFENLLLGRRVMFEIMALTENENSWKISKSFCKLAVVNELHCYNEHMCIKKNTQKSINAAVYLDQISSAYFSNENQFVNNVAKYNLAKAFWVQKSDTRFSIETIKQIITSNEYFNISSENILKRPSISTKFLTATIAQWCEESRQDTSSEIMKKYIDPIFNNLKETDLNSFKDLGLTYHIMAKFCDNQISKREVISLQKMKEEIQSLTNDIQSLKIYMKSEKNKQKWKYADKDLVRLKLRYETKTQELKLAKNECNNYIGKAISFYFKSIALDNDDIMESDVDRFCSLWIEYNDVEIDENDFLGLPTYNFVPWNNQLTSKLLDDKSNFQKILSKLLINIAIDHPFHTLYLLKSQMMTKDESDDIDVISRGKASDKIWKYLKNTNPDAHFNVTGITNILESISSFADNSIKIANMRFKNRRPMALSQCKYGQWWIETLPKLMLPLPVKNIAINKSKPYNKDELPIIVKVRELLAIAASGVSQPKIMRITISSGEIQKILLKAPDDLRQDAIMKQVFEKVNNLLWKDIEARKRKLRIRTYNVLPLGPASGILEFVPNSIPLQDILKKLHENDSIDINEARIMMKTVQNNSKLSRIQTFNEICTKISPSLRYFFFNNFTSPDTWFESRKIYSHGLATSSIIGYILGIGDRHCNNILLDKSSGEPIHIDFGVAFDQGKVLPIPETVPFRLTRDLVDGLGLTGTNGMFNKSCEHVFKVLKDNTQYICGILDVLKYDPLYSWTLSPLRKKKLHQAYFKSNNQEEENDREENEDEKNDKESAMEIEERPARKKKDHIINVADIGSEAIAAIDTVKNKLEANGLSNEAVVRQLIREAVDPERLAVIFMGWSPFL